MKFLSRGLFLLFLLVGALIAVSNSQPVQVALWPLPHVVVLPLYLLIVALLLAGVLAGLALGWWAARPHRRRARERGNEAARLDRELTRLQDDLRSRGDLRSGGASAASQTASQTVSSPGQPLSREQKAIERQSALVAPELAQPAARGPFA
jgi:uncharacterized integral membrane protein